MESAERAVAEIMQTQGALATSRSGEELFVHRGLLGHEHLVHLPEVLNLMKPVARHARDRGRRDGNRCHGWER